MDFRSRLARKAGIFWRRSKWNLMTVRFVELDLVVALFVRPLPSRGTTVVPVDGQSLEQVPRQRRPF
jgi:hypothetical protein